VLYQASNVDLTSQELHPSLSGRSDGGVSDSDRKIGSVRLNSSISNAFRPKTLVTIGHSYCVALNRRLAHEMARVGDGRWAVTVVAPSLFQGDLGPIALQPPRGEACSLEAVPVHFKRSPHLFLYGKRLREILRFPWDVVHCWEEPYVFAGAQIAWLKDPRSAFVFWSYQNIAKRYPPPFSQLEQFCLERCDGWIASGFSVERTLAGRGYGLKPHRTLPLGVDVDVFRPDPESGRSVREGLGWSDFKTPVVGFLGRFVEGKGLRLLTRTLDHLPSWRALLVGGGPLETHLRQWAAGYGERVKIVTGVAHGQVAAYLNAMDVLCAPSQTTADWREQFGRMLIEAFACGVPVIASDSGEIPHVVGDAALLVGEKDESGWRSALSTLMTDASLRAELGARGLERAKSVYAWPIVAQSHLTFFDELLEARRDRGTAVLQ
jgi:glycosyltransferase involved in cell wall biosynthesis